MQSHRYVGLFPAILPPKYTLSDSQMRHGWDILRTIDYLSNAEQSGVELRMPNGSYPIIDGIRFGGVLPEIIVTGKRKNKH